MVISHDEDDGHGRAGALEALLDVAKELNVINDFPIPNTVFRPQDYEEIIAIAWRHQFNEDRSKFKKDIRELEQHVSPRILSNLEKSE